MKLAIVVNTNDPETNWNALRLGNQALSERHAATIFLLGSGVEMPAIKHKDYNIAQVMDKFLAGGGNLLACGTCLTARQQGAGVCSVSTMSELVKTIAGSDKIISLG